MTDKQMIQLRSEVERAWKQTAATQELLKQAHAEIERLRARIAELESRPLTEQEQLERYGRLID